jgi:arsenate reductase-like glutaredoxin family protein
VRSVGEDRVKLRHLIKDPLSRAEIVALVELVGDASALIAPKRRAEAEGLTGKPLLEWLAADGGHVRRPIVVIGKRVTLGFNAEAQAALAKLV